MYKLFKALIGVGLMHGLLVSICCAAPEFSGVLKSAGKTYLALRPEGGTMN